MKIDVFLGSEEVNRIIGLDDVIDADAAPVKAQPVQVVKPKKVDAKPKVEPVVEDATVVEVKEVEQPSAPAPKKEAATNADPWDTDDSGAFETVKAPASASPAKQPVVLEGETADALSSKLDALFGK